VLVNFWATWCEPCRAEMPSMNRLRAALAGAPFEILAVNVGEPQTRIERFLEQVPLDFPVLLDRDTAVAKAWKARILPASFLIGPDGKIRHSTLGEIDWTRADVRQRVERMLPR
jgi:thiol-disulfide isomerase/thioredoxin